MQLTLTAQPPEAVLIMKPMTLPVVCPGISVTRAIAPVTQCSSRRPKFVEQSAPQPSAVAHQPHAQGTLLAQMEKLWGPLQEIVRPLVAAMTVLPMMRLAVLLLRSAQKTMPVQKLII